MDYTNSVNKIVEELKMRVDTMNAFMPSNTLNSNYDDLINILNNYEISYPLNNNDIKKIKKSDLKKVLTFIGEFNIDELINNPDCDLISKDTNTYILEYKSINQNQEDMKRNKIEYYQKYIDLFTKNQFEELFTNFDDLEKLMSLINIDKKDRWVIFLYIDSKNKELIKFNDINNVSIVLSFIKEFLSYDDYKKVIIDYIYNTNIDIELLPIKAKKIAEENNLDEMLTLNVLSSLVIVNLINQGNYDDIYTVLMNIKPFINKKYVIINKARSLVTNNFDYYMLNKNKVDKYGNMSIPEIEEIFDRETAIDISKLKLISLMKENLDKLSNDDNDLRLDLLEELLDSYDSLNLMDVSIKK